MSETLSTAMFASIIGIMAGIAALTIGEPLPYNMALGLFLIGVGTGGLIITIIRIEEDS